MKSFINFLFSFSFFLYISCSKESPRYDVKGTIYNISTDLKTVRIAHDTIPGLMMPMEMDFNVIDPSSIQDIKIGDSVHFDFVWNDVKPYAENFIIIGKGFIPDRENKFFNDEDYSEREIGDILDDVTLINMDGEEIKLSELGNEYYFISFIFTRCPMPNMCPAAVLKNKVLVNNFKKLSNLNFLLISFDYLYDTPQKLKEYYGSIISEFKNLDVLSSYERIEDIYRLGKQSGCEFWGIENGKIGHTMQSILIDRNRKILGKWPGENWEVGMAENSIRYIINND